MHTKLSSGVGFALLDVAILLTNAENALVSVY